MPERGPRGRHLLGSTPAICTFTPSAGFAERPASSTRISRDGNPPYATGTVSITVTAAVGSSNSRRCTDGVCVFTALAPNASAARNYIWR